ncbi:ACT domain-containing protein, partial [Streptosporangium sp. NPDC006013]
GPDRPGVTSRLFSVLAGFPVVVADVEQVVIRRQACRDRREPGRPARL